MTVLKQTHCLEMTICCYTVHVKLDPTQHEMREVAFEKRFESQPVKILTTTW